MGDLRNTVTTVFKADTSQARAAVASLRGAERDRAKALLDDLNKENAALEASLAKWAKIGLVVAGAVGAFALLHKAHKAYLEDVRLESAAAGVNVEKLKAATRGLVEEDNLLAFAGKTQNGVWKLNQQEMERVLKGAMALRKTMGVELQPTVDALTEAITKGSTRALKEFGIEAKDKQGALAELDKIVKQVGGNFDMAGDDIARAGVKAKDALDNLMGALGHLVEALGPAIGKLAEFVEWTAKALGGPTYASSASGDPEQIKALIINNAMLQRKMPGNKDLDRIEAELWKDYDKALAKGVEAINADLIKTLDAQTEAGIAWMADIRAKGMAELARKDAARNRAGRGGGGLTTTSDYAGRVYFPSGGGELGVGGALGSGGIDFTDLSGFQGDEAKKQQARQAAASAEAERLLAAQAEAEKHKKLFEAVFGSPEEISAVGVALNLAQTAVQGLTNAIAESFEAWITGAESAGDVFKRVVAGFVHSMGVELAQVAAKHLVLAAVDAVTLNPFGAGQHLAAAGIAGAGAAGMFALASAMGYGSQKPTAPAAHGTAGAALAGGYSGSGGSGNTGDRTTIIYLAADWSDETPTQRKQKLARAVREGAVARTSNIVIHH